MSRDIRSYFTSPSSSRIGENVSLTKAKKRQIISSDEDEAKTNSPIKRHKRSSKKHILSGSEDELDVTKKKRNVSKASRIKESEIKPKKVVSPLDIFGNIPVKRIEAPKATEALQKLEAGFHCDDDFEATLNQLDTSRIVEAYLGDVDKKGENDLTLKRDKNESNVVATSSGKQESCNTFSLEDDARAEKGHSKDEEYLDNRRLEEKVDEAIEKIKKGYEDDKRMNRTKLEYKQKGNEQDKGSNVDDENTKILPRRTKGTSKLKKERKFNCSSSEERKYDDDVTAVTVNRNVKSKRSEGMSSQIQIEKKSRKEVNERDRSADPYEEMIEKRKEKAALYQQYLHRGGARNPGCKEIPAGAEYCLAGLSFVITGVLDSLERETAEDLINKYGGRVLQQVSRKIDYVVIGDQPGPSKLEKANNLGIKKMSEDDLLELIRSRPAGKASNVKQSRSRTWKRDDDCKEEMSPERKPMEVEAVLSFARTKVELRDEEASESQRKMRAQIESDEPAERVVGSEMRALVEKYRPTSMKQIIGQQGNKSSAVKLYTWLENWKKNQSGNVKRVKPSPWAKNNDGAFFKAALLSGPPGIGKTTTAQVTCKELGLDYLEFNASDTRSKRLLKERVAELLSNRTMKGCFVGDRRERKPTSNHVLIMDEVDGMAGNEDRGGLQELIALIKSTDIPIICICNDRSDLKMRTLANYAFDLPFQKPRLEQIRAAMMSVCYKENIKMSKEDLNDLIEGTNYDIRQVINQLAMLIDKPYSADRSKGQRVNKDVRLGPWNVIRKVFGAAEHNNMSIHDKSNLFFHDYNMGPLFVQENYLSIVPDAPKSELLERVAEAAESLALGDVVERTIRSSGSWSLLPMQACYSSVIPGTVMSGRIASQMNFPSWLGRNSKQGKFNRLLQEITMHARLATAASKEAINLDYLAHLRDAIVRPLAVNGAAGTDEALAVMNRYHLMREDLDSIIEISLWPGQRDPMQAVESKVKAAFTRTYNKSCAMAPYAVDGRATKRKAPASQAEDFIESEEEEEGGHSEEENDDDVISSRTIKAKKPASDKRCAASGSKGDAKRSKRGRSRGGSKAK